MVKELFTKDAFKFIFGFLLLVFLSLAIVTFVDYFFEDQQAKTPDKEAPFAPEDVIAR